MLPRVNYLVPDKKHFQAIFERVRAMAFHRFPKAVVLSRRPDTAAGLSQRSRTALGEPLRYN